MTRDMATVSLIEIKGYQRPQSRGTHREASCAQARLFLLGAAREAHSSNDLVGMTAGTLGMSRPLAAIGCAFFCLSVLPSCQMCLTRHVWHRVETRSTAHPPSQFVDVSSSSFPRAHVASSGCCEPLRLVAVIGSRGPSALLLATRSQPCSPLAVSLLGVEDVEHPGCPIGNDVNVSSSTSFDVERRIATGASRGAHWREVRFPNGGLEA